jgi:hypothetical protein
VEVRSNGDPQNLLSVAARLYRRVGFRKAEEMPGRLWGVDVVEERCDLDLDPLPPR